MKNFKLIMTFIAVLFLVICVPKASGAGNDNLDSVIRELSDYLNTRIPKDNKVVFLNVKSDWSDFSEYILSVLQENAVNDDFFSVVDRRQLNDIRSELQFQWSGEVNDKSAQEIGQMLGAQTIVSGVVTQIDNTYRIQVRAISVQTAAVLGLSSRSVSIKDPIVKELTSGKKPTPAKKSTTEKSQKMEYAADTFLRNTGFIFGGGVGFNSTSKSITADSSKKSDSSDSYNKSDNDDSSEKSNSNSTSYYGGADIEFCLFRYFGLQAGIEIFQDCDTVNPFSEPLVTQTILQIPVVARLTLPIGLNTPVYNDFRDLGFFLSVYGGLGLNIVLDSNPVIKIKSTSSYNYLVGGDMGILFDYGRIFFGFQYNSDLSDTIYDYGPKKDLKYLGKRTLFIFGCKYFVPFRN
jgi:hypothetical protein